MNNNLSAAQFGGGQAPALPEPPRPQGIQPGEGPEAPLPLGESTFGSVKQASVWRKPRNQVLPSAKGTLGTVFDPFAQ